MNNNKIKVLNEEIDKLAEALTVISRFEQGDSIQLKRSIREEIETLERIIENLSE